MRRFALAAAIAAVFTALSPRAAVAQTIGVRAGVSGDPTQFYAGVHVQAGPVFDHVWFRPNVEAGFGQDEVLVALNFELVWRNPIKKQPWTILVGAGPSAVFITRDESGGSTTDAGGGFNILLGVEHTKGFFSELKLGLIDSPSIKFAVGYSFK